jgi:hypothetical protein
MAVSGHAGLSLELLETRHVRDAFKAMPVQTDRTDARGIAADAAGLVSLRALQITADRPALLLAAITAVRTQARFFWNCTTLRAIDTAS